MCAFLGIRGVYSQAYHHQANGRAEVQGRIFKDLLRKVSDQIGDATWVELLPIALRQFLDARGPAGLSPYEIVTGRSRFVSALPYQPPREAEDAVGFFARMRILDQKVAKILNALHNKTTERINKARKDPPEFKIGELVWYLRPHSLTAKLESRWVGPYTILSKTGLHSYEIQRVGKKISKSAHETQLLLPPFQTPSGV